ncbi:DUF2937 family protein [Oricola sp.]|uniref:DUF2937 family protein n=1 Tax=Oricola sp. TaxID=1979950 RepID=UPI003204C214
MVWFARTLVVAVGVAGGVVTSQAPEFTQQYRQRLGGALQELRAIVADFEADAARNGLSRAQALSSYRASSDDFLRDRGASMTKTIHRFDTLERQADRFESWPEPALPIAMFGESDAELVKGAWQDFRPGVPVTATGFIWAGIGFVIALLLAQGGRKAGRGLAGSSRRRGVAATRQGDAAPMAVAAGDAPEIAVDPDDPVAEGHRHPRR